MRSSSRTTAGSREFHRARVKTRATASVLTPWSSASANIRFTVGLPRAWLAANIEVYYYVRGPAKNIDVLSYAHEPHTALNWPIEWTVRYGRGRVYTSTFGHVWRGDVQPVTVRDVGVQTLLVRSLQWLARRPIDWPLPSDFPTAAATSVGPPLQ